MLLKTQETGPSRVHAETPKQEVGEIKQEGAQIQLSRKIPHEAVSQLDSSRDSFNYQGFREELDWIGSLPGNGQVLMCQIIFILLNSFFFSSLPGVPSIYGTLVNY